MYRFAPALLAAGLIAGPADAAAITVTISGTFDTGLLAGQPYSASVTYTDANVVPASSPTGSTFAVVPGNSFINNTNTFGDITTLAVSVPALGPLTVFPDADNFVNYQNGQLSTVSFLAFDANLLTGFSAGATFNPGGGVASVFAAGRISDADDSLDNNPSVTVTVSQPAVPEPATLAVFGGLLAAGGVAARRRRAG